MQCCFTAPQKPSNAQTYCSTGMQLHTQSSYRHKDVGTISFHDNHENEVGEYGSSSGMSMIAITIQKIVKQAPEDLNLEDCN